MAKYGSTSAVQIACTFPSLTFPISHVPHLSSALPSNQFTPHCDLPRKKPPIHPCCNRRHDHFTSSGFHPQNRGVRALVIAIKGFTSIAAILSQPRVDDLGQKSATKKAKNTRYPEDAAFRSQVFGLTNDMYWWARYVPCEACLR